MVRICIKAVEIMFFITQVTRLLGGEMFIDSSGSGVGQLQVNIPFVDCGFFLRIRPSHKYFFIVINITIARIFKIVVPQTITLNDHLVSLSD